MKIELTRKGDAFHFEGAGMSSSIVHIDGSENIGGENLGARPMELLLMGLGGCTGIDIVLILKKQKQEIVDFKIEVNGEREMIPDTQMNPFKNINIHYILKGNIDPKKLERAIALSEEKYCSASAQFRCSAKITTSYKIES